MLDRTSSRWVPRHSYFFLLLILLLVIVLELLRLGMILRNRTSLGDAGVGLILSAFAYGLRFDLAVACYITLPFVVIGHLPKWGLRHSSTLRRVILVALTVGMVVLIFILLAEYEFVREFQTRYNQLAFEYLDQPKTVVGMVWYNYSVVRYLLLCALLAGGFALALRWIMQRTLIAKGTITERLEPGYEGISMALLIAGLVIGMRGGVQSEPLRWGDAYHSNNDFVNQMSLNGLFALGRSAADRFGHQKSSPWLRHMPLEEARAITRRLVVEPDEALLDSDQRTVLRKDSAVHNSVTLRKGARAPNVVLVLMESFSARFVGACGSRQDRTPEFNRLAAGGVLFDHAFSSGTHTHQGVFSTLLSFPNLPGYEYLMQNMVANQPFLSLPRLLKQRGYQTLFLYNGNLSWDNMEGFFRKQGVDRFIGARDYVKPIQRDRVWGVSDQDVFDRANEEFEAADAKGPFFSLVLTLSNHAPFDLPQPLAFAPTADMGELNKRIDAVRYADWAVGRFMERARAHKYFQNTLFVFVGDHGFHVDPTLTEAHVLYHHVPLVFYSPMLTSTGVIPTPASQLNVMPTVLGLLGINAPQSCWGRNLFSTDFPDDNMVMFKGSGGSGSAQAVAMIRGDKLLVVGSEGTTRLWQYRLNPDPGIVPLTDPASQAMLNSMQRDLHGYVQSAMTELPSHKIERPESLLYPIANTGEGSAKPEQDRGLSAARSGEAQ